MRKIYNWYNKSAYFKPISPGCKMCADGSKMVVLITGICSTKCYYCPLSEKKIGTDKIFADEWELKNENDKEKLLLEAKYIKATGAGITGGDPLHVWERTKKYIELLKKTYGKKFHIHMYTSGIKNSEHIEDLVIAGLDEVRFHPLPNCWNDMDNCQIGKIIINTIKLDVDVAIEIPALPGKEYDTLSLIYWADRNGVKWVNINELEFSETNAKTLKNKGFDVKDDISAAVSGSEELALKILNIVAKNNISIGVHYCSSSFKDGIQLKNRIKRRAKNIAKPHELVTNEGTILKGIIPVKNSEIENLNNILKKEFNLKEKQIFVNSKKNRIELSVGILEKIALELIELGYESFMVEEYPTADALEVERTPLPLKIS